MNTVLPKVNSQVNKFCSNEPWVHPNGIPRYSQSLTMQCEKSEHGWSLFRNIRCRAKEFKGSQVLLQDQLTANPRYSQSLTILDIRRENSQVHKFCCYEPWVHPTHGRSSLSWGSLEPHNNPLLPVKTWNDYWLKTIKIHINYNITLLNGASIYSWQFKPQN